jgi:branched-chain amino acid transport system permease protein
VTAHLPVADERLRRILSGATLWALLAVAAVILPAALGPYWAFVIGQAAVVSIIVLSLTLLTGFAGQVSLAQSAFVGAGAYTCAQLAMHLGWNLFEALPGAVLIGFCLGVLVGIPALRLRGIYLAISTLGLAVVADRLVFQLPQLGGLNGLSLTRPRSPIDLSSNLAMAYACLALLLILLLTLWRLREGRTGWWLQAIRDDERAAEMAGVDVAVYKLLVFGYSGAAAALGGALLGYLSLHLNPLDFSALNSVSYLALVVVVGRRSLAGALAGGALWIVIPQVAEQVDRNATEVLQIVLPLLLVVGVFFTSGRLRVKELARGFA